MLFAYTHTLCFIQRIPCTYCKKEPTWQKKATAATQRDADVSDTAYGSTLSRTCYRHSRAMLCSRSKDGVTQEHRAPPDLRPTLARAARLSQDWVSRCGSRDRTALAGCSCRLYSLFPSIFCPLTSLLQCQLCIQKNL